MKLLNNKKRNKLEMADEGLHFSLLNKILSKKLKKDTKILILGSGSGIFDKSLIESGYNNITSIDISDGNYDKSLKTKFIKSDLNEPFDWADGKYDLIVASEVIEHLENTANFLRSLKSILNNDGLCILTTPNPLEITSKINMLLSGNFTAYTTKSLSWGHINPIFPHILKHHLKNEGLIIKDEEYNREFFDQLRIYSWKSYIYYPILWIFSKIIGAVSLNKQYDKGVILIYEIIHK